MKRKKTIIISSGVIATVIILSLFLSKTSRGGSLMIYLVGGWGVPTEVKTQCITQTEENIKVKFTNPPDFPWAALDGLKSFWYYSYFNECLYEQGYDFSGNSIPFSGIKNTDEVYTYTNGLSGLTFIVSSTTKVTQNNYLDVDYHHKLYESILNVDGSDIVLHVYDYNDNEDELDKIISNPTNLSRTQGNILEYSKQENKDDFIRIKVVQDDEYIGYILITDYNNVIHIHGKKSAFNSINQILESAHIEYI